MIDDSILHAHFPAYGRTFPAAKWIAYHSSRESVISVALAQSLSRASFVVPMMV
jgi:hypothetical protein